MKSPEPVINNQLGRSPNAADQLYAARRKDDFSGTSEGLAWNASRHGMELSAGKESSGRNVGHYESKPIACDFPATEFLPSWNMDIDEKTQGYRIFLRVRGPKGRWSPWFYLGSGGTLTPKRKSSSRVTRHEDWGNVRIDYLHLAKPASAFQYRVILESANEGSKIPAPALQRFFVAFSGQVENSTTFSKGRKFDGREKSIPVPYRSQKAVDEEDLRGHICCPTCVAMLLQHYGVNLPTMEVCRQAYDSESKIYGVWPRATHTASRHGLEGWIQRFRSHDEVKAMLATGQPVMASIRVADGELRGADYRKSNGHLILLVGFKTNGDYIVNDPYTTGPGGAAIDYHQDDIEKVWLECGGVGLIIKLPENS